MAFRDTVLDWYRGNKRDLPWRRTDDPYRILVSEVMLQQTQVPRAVPIFSNFIRQFPTIQKLAQASLGDVLKAWKGLGYNRRAKYLWLAAQAANGRLPQTEEELRKLPGIGAYTAAAVMAFAHNIDSVPIDTNIRRIYYRYFRDASEEKIGATLPKGKAADWNSALMDFGSLVCTKNPQCAVCPLRRGCKAYKEQDFAVPVPKQSTFKGSNRFYRGKIIDALRGKKHTEEELLTLGPKEKMVKALASLEKESLVRRLRDHYTL